MDTTVNNTNTVNTPAAGTQPTPAGTQPTPAGKNTNTAATPAIDIEAFAAKAAEIAAKKENAVMRSFFEQNGLSKEEAEKAIADYKAQKQKQEEADKNDAVKQIKKAQDELAALKAELAKERYDKSILEICKSEGVKEGREQFIANMIKQSDIMKEGKFDAEAAKNAVKAVLELVPELKKSETPAQQGGVIKIGAQAPAQASSATTNMTTAQKFAAYIAANKKQF